MEENIDTIVDIVDKYMEDKGLVLTTLELDDIREVLECANESRMNQ